MSGAHITIWIPQSDGTEARLDMNELQAFVVVGLDMKGSMLTRSGGKQANVCMMLEMAKLEFVVMPMQMKLMAAEMATQKPGPQIEIPNLSPAMMKKVIGGEP